MKNDINTSEKKLGFSLRGLENTRIESLSDGVFAIAIGLLLISSSPPTNFIELKEFTKDFIPFGITISVLIWIWYQHYLFFIRFGLRDPKTTALNTIVLFLILFYVYPLKFLIGVLFELYKGLIFGDKELINKLFTDVIKPENTPELMSMYGFGAAGIFVVIALLNFRAYSLRNEIKLSKIEIALTQQSIRINLVSAFVPLLSGFFAYTVLFGDATFIVSGFTYMLYIVLMPVIGIYGRKKIDAVKAMEKD
ncbi:MAG: DUF1211 domain-containing protein [Bacteroidia bacterium]